MYCGIAYTSSMRTIAPVLVIVALFAIQAGAQPTDNPVSSQYGAGAYDWTDNLNWSNVYNISDYGGVANDPSVDNTSAFNAARDAAAADGGGVVYFGSGEWHFDQDLYLKDGVVIRGETPTDVTNATQEGYSPPSKLVFPKYEPTFEGSGTPNDTAFKNIYSENPETDSNLGVANLDINRAGIKLGAKVDGPTAKNHLVFGVRSNNVATPDPGVPNEDQHGWQRWSYRFGNNISADNWRNILIANNRLNDNVTDNYEQNGYLIEDGGEMVELEGEKAPFSYTDHYGIVSGRGTASWGSGWPGDRDTGGTDPVRDPKAYRPGIDIVDNYVKTTKRVKIHAGGLGTIIARNVLDDEEGKEYWVHPTGTKYAQYAQTFENRGIDFEGSQLLIEENDYTVYRGQIRGSGYYSVDGEGVLTQGMGGITRTDGVVIRNNTGNAYIGIYKMWDINDVEISGNTLEDRGGVDSSQSILVLADTNAGPASGHHVQVVDNDVAESIIVDATIEGTDFEVLNNTIGGDFEFNDWITESGNVVGGDKVVKDSEIDNLPPFVELTNYSMGNYKETYELPEHPELEIELQAEAGDPDGEVDVVEFYNQDELIGEDTDGSDGWSVNFTADEPGEHMFNALVYDDEGMRWWATPMYVDMVPEPGSLALLAVGSMAVALRRRRS